MQMQFRLNQNPGSSFIRGLISLLFSILLFFNSSYAQHKYYFSSKANKEGNGSKQQPFISLEQLSKLSLQPADSVFFPGGETLKGNINISNINGSKEHPVVFTSYGSGKCIIDGRNQEAFVINGGDHFLVSDLILIGSGRKTGNTTDGLKLINCKNAGIRDIDVSGFQESGLLVYDCETTEIDSVDAHENGMAGILIEGDYQKRISNNIHIINCRAYNNPGDPTKLDNHSGNGIIVGNCKNVLIEYCTATNNGWDMPRVGNGPVGIWAYEADSVIIQNCISYRNKTAPGAADGGGFDLDGGVTNSIIQYCLSYENQGSGYGIYQYYGAGKWNNNTVRYCISINDGHITDKASAMLIWNGHNGDSTFTRFYAYNNFFYNDKKAAFGFDQLSQHKQFSFFNNIFVAADTANIFDGIDSSMNDLFLGNTWMRKNGGFMQNGFTDIEKWAFATGYEKQNGKLTGNTFQRSWFSLPAQIKITTPRELQTNLLLHSFCNPVLHNKGIDLKKTFGIDVGEQDFFGNIIAAGDHVEPGICEMK